MNFRDWLEEKAILNQGRQCILYKDEVITYNQMNDKVNQVANAMYNLGIRKGDKVAVLMPNCPEFVYLWFGLAKIGAISAFVNTGMKSDSLSYLLTSSDSTIMIIDKSFWANYLEVEKTAKMRKIVCFPNLEGIQSPPAEMVGYNEIVSQATSTDPPKEYIDEGDPLGFLHTAGTTGRPKWCIISHKAYIHAGESFRDFCLINKTDVLYDPLPMFHANPQFWYIMPAIAGNASFVVTEKLSVSKYWEHVRQYKVTHLTTHFAPISYLLSQAESPSDTDHNVRVAGPVAHRKFMERFNIPVMIGGYGSTEVTNNICTSRYFTPIPKFLDRFGDRIYQFCGPSRHDFDVKIFDEKDNEVAIGIVGEIVVKAKEPHIMFDGYYKMPEKTAEAFRSGYFHTGDRGYMDGESNLYFAERQAESISVKGEWVHIDEVEAAIASHPNVADGAVVGVPAQVGSDIKAYVQLKPGLNLDPVELIKHCETKLARYMIPRYIEYVSEFPRTFGTEKIQRPVLKSRGIGDAWDREKAGYKLSR